MLDLDVPGFAIRREVSDNISAKDAREPARLRALGGVEESTRAIDDIAVRSERRNDLLGIVVECVDAQRHPIVKQTEAAANRRLCVSERTPRKPNARRDANGFGDALPFEPRPYINRKPWRDNPVILAEEPSLEIKAIEPVASDPVDAFQQTPGQVLNLNRPRDEITAGAGPRDSRSQLQVVRAEQGYRRQGISLDPLCA